MGPFSGRLCLACRASIETKYSLADAKELSHNVQCAKQTPPRTGRAIVVDYLNYPESRAVAEAMTQTGLQITTLFNVAQATSYCIVLY